MLDPQLLKQAVRTFRRDGYIVWRGFYNSEEMQELMQQIDRYVKEVLPTLPKNRAFFADKSDMATLFRLEQMQVDPWFEAFYLSERMTGLARTLLDDDIKPQQVEMFGKAPRGGEATPPHQDGNYWMLVPNEGVTMWLALDVVDEENGCLRYVPGSHRKPMRNHAIGNTFGFSLGMTDFGPEDEKAEVAICAEPGDLIVHHGLTIHRAMGFVYFADRAQADTVAVNAHQQAVHDQWAAQNKL